MSTEERRRRRGPPVAHPPHHRVRHRRVGQVVVGPPDRCVNGCHLRSARAEFARQRRRRSRVA
eukprot:1899343-Pleurochrysis_carterae.AAC.1